MIDGLVLFLRGRRVVRQLVVVAAVSLLSVGIGGRLIDLPAVGAGLSTARAPAELLLPAISGCAAAIASSSGAEALERIASTDLRWCRIIHALVLLIVPVLILGTGWLTGFDGAWTAVRASLGYLGLGLLAAAAIGGAFGFVVPFGFLMLTVFFGLGPTGPRMWCWPLLPSSSSTAWVWVTCILLAGVGGYTVLGSRRRAAESPDYS